MKIFKLSVFLMGIAILNVCCKPIMLGLTLIVFFKIMKHLDTKY